MAFKMTMHGNKALLEKIGKLSEKVRQGVADELEASGYNIHAKAVSRAPVDTGILKNSLNMQNKEMTVQVEATANYAPYVEFGTGGSVDVPTGLEDYAMQFKGKGVAQVNMPARPFLFNSFFEEKPKLMENLRKVIKNGTK